MDSTKALIEEIMEARQKRTETVHEKVLEAREKIRLHLHPESPTWLREAFDILHAVHHILGGDPFDMHMRAALSAQGEAAQPAAEGWLERERICMSAGMSQWERSLKRPDLAEKDRVRGALEAYQRQAFALEFLVPAMNDPLPASPAAQEKSE